MSQYSIRLLGPTQVECEGNPVRGFRSRKAIALLGFLVLHPYPISRRQLADLFWRDKLETQGRANLCWVLHNLSTLLPGCFNADHHTISFQRGAQVWVDVFAFEALTADNQVTRLDAAVDLYRGELMSDLHVNSCPGFENWLIGEREHRHQRVLRALNTLIDHNTRCGKNETAMQYTARLLTLDPGCEEAHQQMMRLLVLTGQRSAALTQYEACRRALAEELGLEPSPETNRLYAQIQNSQTPPVHNLPVPLTPFINRPEELAQINNHLANPDCRLLTLTGAGGMGKTRLALQTASPKQGRDCTGFILSPWPRSVRSLPSCWP